MAKKDAEKYKHKDEETWLAKNPGKEFKPFNPDWEIIKKKKK